MISEEAQLRFREVFGYPPRCIGESPGRVELIGNHTDYNAGWVLAMTIDRRLAVAAAPRSDGLLQLASSELGQEGPARASDFLRDGPGWTRYIAGTYAVLESMSQSTPGFDMVIVSDIPEGAGLSSSAALEVASALAMQTGFELELSPTALAKAARVAENDYVGVPCGMLDQATVTLGGDEHAVLIDAAAERVTPVPIPENFRLFVFGTQSGHRLVDGQYALRHAECHQAWSHLRKLSPGARGLAECTLGTLAAAESQLPAEVSRRARHVIQEHGRVQQAVQAMKNGNLPRLGSLLNQSFASSQHLFENSSPEQDALVAELQSTDDVTGARLTGGGFGGSVIALVGSRFSSVHAQTVCSRVSNRLGIDVAFYLCQPSPGALLRTTKPSSGKASRS